MSDFDKAITRLTVQHVLDVLDFDWITTERILRGMTSAEIRTLIRQAEALAAMAHNHLANRCTCLEGVVSSDCPLHAHEPEKL